MINIFKYLKSKFKKPEPVKEEKKEDNTSSTFTLSIPKSTTITPPTGSQIFGMSSITYTLPEYEDKEHICSACNGKIIYKVLKPGTGGLYITGEYNYHSVGIETYHHDKNHKVFLHYAGLGFDRYICNSCYIRSIDKKYGVESKAEGALFL